jgi:hypothetical protein
VRRAADENGRVVGVDDPAEQMHQVFRNLGIALNAAGSGFDRIVNRYRADSSSTTVTTCGNSSCGQPQ